MMMAVFGNIVTAWSWFGTNLLEVGLHSYGFTDKGPSRSASSSPRNWSSSPSL